MQEDGTKRRDRAQLGQFKRAWIVQEDMTEGRDDAGGHYKREGSCMRTLQKGGTVRREGIMKGRDEAEGCYKWEG